MQNSPGKQTLHWAAFIKICYKTLAKYFILLDTSCLEPRWAVWKASFKATPGQILPSVLANDPKWSTWTWSLKAEFKERCSHLNFWVMRDVQTICPLKQPVIMGRPQHYQCGNPSFRRGLKAVTSGPVMMLRLKWDICFWPSAKKKITFSELPLGTLGLIQHRWKGPWLH